MYKIHKYYVVYLCIMSNEIQRCICYTIYKLRDKSKGKNSLATSYLRCTLNHNIIKEVQPMSEPKGYNTSYGYMGYVANTNSYMLFASESEYIDYITD